MEATVNQNGKENLQTNPNNEEQITFISEVEAKKKMLRLYLPAVQYSLYLNAMKRLQEGRGEWCHIRTENYKGVRKAVYTVSKKEGIPLVIKKSNEGLQFRLASNDEVRERKKTANRLVEARQKK